MTARSLTEDSRRLLLGEQLDIVWGFAERFVIPRISAQVCAWEPPGRVVTVRRSEDRWSADWPDEDADPPPQPTIAWLLWHIEWWLGNASQCVRGEQSTAATDHEWSGSAAGITAAHTTWLSVLAVADLDEPVEGLMPTPRPAAFIAAWVNFELTKNISEIHQLLNQAQTALGIAPRLPA